MGQKGWLWWEVSQSGEEKPVDLLGEVLWEWRECGYPGKGRSFIDELQENKKYKREI